MSTLRRCRFHFTLKQLLLAILVAGVLLGAWVSIFRKVVTVRPARSDDPVCERYLGIDGENAEIRNIVIVEGTFTKSTWLTVSLYVVQAAKFHDVSRITMGRSPMQLGSPPWKTLKITLALGSWDAPHGRVVQLGSAGYSRGGGAGLASWPVSFASTFTDAFAGCMPSGREYIIYAEGDSRINMDRNMTVSNFAQKNSGNYFLVTAQLR